MPSTSYERPSPLFPASSAAAATTIAKTDHYTPEVNLAPPAGMTPAIKVAFPTSMSLSIPFFSRSASSTTSTSTSSGSYSYSYSCSYSTSTDLEDHDLSPMSGSFPRPGQSQGKYDHGNRQHQHGGYDHMQLSQSRSSLGSTASSVRPPLKKMPSWSSWNLGLENSRSTSSDRESAIILTRNASSDGDGDGDGEDHMDGIVSRLPLSDDQRNRTIGRRGSGRLHLDIGTWGKSPKIFLSSRSRGGGGRNNDDNDKASGKHVHANSFPLRVKPRYSSVAHKVPEAVPSDIFPPLTRVWARTNNKATEVSDIGFDRERRGSDWPPTQGRDMNLDLSGIMTLADEATEDMHNDIDNDDDDQDRVMVQPQALSDVLDEDADMSDRVDTPMEIPTMPRLDLRSRSSILSPVLDGEEEEGEGAETVAEEDADADSPETEKEKEEFFTPSPIPASLFTRTPYPSRMDDVVEHPTFDLSIFSPRPPPPPVLRGILDNLPVSPLELPVLRNSLPTFPTPVLPRDPPTSPLHMPAPRRGIPGESIESVLHPSLSRRCSIVGGDRPRRPSIPGLPRRRMSLIIRPAILPCPTPPSLLTSPKTLGSEYIPPLFSPSSISPVNSRFLSGTGNSSLPRRRGRGSMRLKLPPSYFSEGGAGLGIEPAEEKNKDEVPEKEEHVATPGTFGLEGEKERLEGEGVNPYFA
ncbi:hypothetical protein IAT40_000178 [Kwoniella sp. CBS 6097]